MDRLAALGILDHTENLVKKLSVFPKGLSPSREEKLDLLAKAISDSINHSNKAEVIVICTHNSRRSHIGQLMLKLAAICHNLGNVFTYSGGTEATAMNVRVARALKDHGLEVKQLTEGLNPKYYIPLVDNDPLLDIHFSKPYDNSYNPQQGFIAVMVCDDADEACPVVAGATYRISLPYIDPKISDDTEDERKIYYDKVIEIGREMFLVMDKVKKMSGTA